MEKNNGLTWTFPYPLPLIGSIATGRVGGFQYSPVFWNVGVTCTAPVMIAMSGNRNTDRQNFIALNPGNWQGCHFHHTFTFNIPVPGGATCFAQMVTASAHIATYRHTGAAWQCKQAYPGTYRMFVKDFLHSWERADEPVFVETGREASAEDVSVFAYANQLTIPGWLSEVFQGKTGLPKFCKTADGGVEAVESVIPLTVKGEQDFNAGYILGLPVIKEIFADFFPGKKVIPYADDPCGNLYVCVDDKTYFYDHEEDGVVEVVPLTQSL